MMLDSKQKCGQRSLKSSLFHGERQKPCTGSSEKPTWPAVLA